MLAALNQIYNPQWDEKKKERIGATTRTKLAQVAHVTPPLPLVGATKPCRKAKK
jgi:hypothetical protein